MSDPSTPNPSSVPDVQLRVPESSNLSTVSLGNTWGYQIFHGPQGLRPMWRLVLYFAVVLGCYGLGQLLESVLFPTATYGQTALWETLFEEVVRLMSVLAPAGIMARIEERPIDDFGLPRQQVFGKMFWLGCVWGISAITALLLVMRSAQVFYFGHPVLHGARVLRFALFWGLFFLVVAFFEEFLMRGYSLFTLSQSTGFWPAAVLSSCAFGAIHLLNPGEAWTGIGGAAAIGFFFCLTIRRTGSIWFAVGFHAAWDWGETFLWGVPDSGTTSLGHLFAPSLVNGPTWLTGGTVGPEGSVLCFLLIAVLWALFHFVYPRATYSYEAAVTAPAS